jgi:hypothetical protein
MPETSFTKSDGVMGKIVVAVVVTLLVGGSAPWWWCKAFSCTFTTSMEKSTLTCHEICQARGADCVSAKVPSQQSGVADCNFTHAGGEPRSKACICREG